MPPSANPYDQASRFAAQLDPLAFLGWALDLAADQFAFRGWLDTRNIPFPGERDRTGDLVARLDDPAEHLMPWAVAIEFQTAPDAIMFGRMLTYLARLWTELKPDPEHGSRFHIGGVVLNLKDQGNASRDMRWPAAGLITQLGVRERNLSRESADELLTAIESGQRSRGLLPWIPLMTGGDDPVIIDRWKRAAEAEPEHRRRSDLGGLALILAEVVDREVLWQDALKEWNMVRSKIVEGWQAQARIEAARTLVLRLGKKKFGRAPTKKQQADLDTITDYARLEGLGEKLLEVGSWGELLAGP